MSDTSGEWVSTDESGTDSSTDDSDGEDPAVLAAQLAALSPEERQAWAIAEDMAGLWTMEDRHQEQYHYKLRGLGKGRIGGSQNSWSVDGEPMWAVSGVVQWDETSQSFKMKWVVGPEEDIDIFRDNIDDGSDSDKALCRGDLLLVEGRPMILRNGLFTNQLGGGSFEGARVVKVDGGKWVPEFPKEAVQKLARARAEAALAQFEPQRIEGHIGTGPRISDL